MNQGRQIIPVEMEERIAELEELMSFGKLKDKTLHELFDLYNVIIIITFREQVF